jgi:hypothetical protein
MEDRLTERLPDGSYRLRRDIDAWDQAEIAHRMEQELQALRIRCAVQQKRIATLERNAQKMTAGKIAASEAVKA